MSTQKYSHSGLQLYRLCPLRYALHYEWNLLPQQQRDAHDLLFGSAWDSALNALYGGRGIEGAITAFTDTYPPENYPNPLPVRAQGKSHENGIAAITSYHDRWQEEDGHWEVLEVQQRHDNEDGYILKLDMVVRDDRDDQVWGVDNKSTGSYLKDLWKRFEPNSQVRMYTDHIKSRYGHCGGFVVNATSFKYRSKAATYQGVKYPAGPWHEFARMVFNPNSECLELERDNFIYWTNRIEHDRESGEWGYNDQACHQYGRECEYFKLCSNGYTWPRDQELVLESHRQVCPKVLESGRCQLDLGHEGEHDPTPPAPPADYRIEMNEEIEDAVS